MKKKLFMVSMLVFVLMLAFSTNVVLAGKPVDPVGDRLNLFTGPTEWSAGEPFHVNHGFYMVYLINEPVGNSFAKSIMSLEICDAQEGCVELEADFIDTVWGADPNYFDPYLNMELPVKYYGKFFTFNFPEGLPAGEYTFIRHYYFTCQSYLFNGDLLECSHPTDLIENPSIMQTRVVTFE